MGEKNSKSGLTSLAPGFLQNFKKFCDFASRNPNSKGHFGQLSATLPISCSENTENGFGWTLVWRRGARSAAGIFIKPAEGALRPLWPKRWLQAALFSLFVKILGSVGPFLGFFGPFSGSAKILGRLGGHFLGLFWAQKVSLPSNFLGTFWPKFWPAQKSAQNVQNCTICFFNFLAKKVGGQSGVALGALLTWLRARDFCEFSQILGSVGFFEIFLKKVEKSPGGNVTGFWLKNLGRVWVGGLFENKNFYFHSVFGTTQRSTLF